MERGKTKTSAQAARAQAAKAGKSAPQTTAARPSPNPGSYSGKTGKIVSAPDSKLEPVAVKPKSGDTDWIKFRGQMQRDVGKALAGLRQFLDRRNEPAFLPHIANAVARLRGETLAALSDATTTNARRLFRFDLAST